LEQIEAVPTQNLEAYNYYLKGIDYINRSYTEKDMRYSIQMNQKAVDLDPNFTLAWVNLASASRAIYWWHFDRSEEHVALTKEYLDKAITLDPHLFEVKFETGKYLYHCELNYSEALQILEGFIFEFPDNDLIYLWAGFIYRRMGQFEKALEYMDYAISLNPSESLNWFEAGLTLTVLGRYQQAKEHYHTAMGLNPSGHEIYYSLAETQLLTGETEKARELLNYGNFNQTEIFWIRSYAELICRNYNNAINILQSSPHKVVSDQNVYIPKSLQFGLIYYTMSNKKLAMDYFHEARMDLEEDMCELSSDSRLYGSLAITYAGLGMIDEAISTIDLSLSIIDSSKDAYRGFYRELDMARVLMMVGEYDMAVEKLEDLLEKNGLISIELLNNDPFWDPLRNRETFKSLIKNASTKSISMTD
jgi:tetratricopeptide (TPR) repeat protein